MNVPDVGQILLASLNGALIAVATFLPKFVAGLIILLIGIIVASVVRQLAVGLMRTLNIEKFLRRYNVPEGRREFTWTNILGEIVRWFIIIIFLIPTAEVWGLPQIDAVLRSFLMYLPNVFVAVIIGLVGFVVARLAYDVVLASTSGLSQDTTRGLALATRYAVNVFTILAVLTQLGVAADLIRILFTGFVAMVALAGGIAFGLGGQGAAREMLDNVRKNMMTTSINTDNAKQVVKQEAKTARRSTRK